MLISDDLEGALSSLANLVQCVLKRVDLPFDLFEGRALWRDEQAAVLAPCVAQGCRSDGRRIVWGAGRCVVQC